MSKLQESQAELLKGLIEEAKEHGSENAVKLLKEAAHEAKIKIDEKPKKEIKKVIQQEEVEDDVDEEIDESYEVGDFDMPFDMVPIPSKGLIYKNIKSKIPVAYLTASDEDLITSPNLYLDGRVIDLLLSKKILDKNIKPENLCKGDRDSIIVWLRSTGYGENFPVSVKDPSTGQPFDTEINLSEIKLNDFKLTPDENNLFDFKLPKTEHEIKFRFMTHLDEINYSKLLEKTNKKIKKHVLNEAKSTILNVLSSDNKMDEKLKKNLELSTEYIKNYVDTIDDDNENYVKSVTYILEKCVVSVNGNTDKKFIKKYVSMIPAFDSIALRRYITENSPSLNYNVTVQRPESLGGGSFTTFLELDSTIFINIS